MGKLAKLSKIEDGAQVVFYPLTIPQAVIDPDTKVSLSTSLSDISLQITSLAKDLSDNYYTITQVADYVADAIAEHNQDELAHEALRNDISLALTTAETASTNAEEAVTVANSFSIVAEEAMTTANAAKNAVATLEGLADADTSSITAASIVTQVESNTLSIQTIQDSEILLSESEFEALEVKDPTKKYYIYED